MVEGYDFFTSDELKVDTDGTLPLDTDVSKVLYQLLADAVSSPGENEDDLDLGGKLVYERHLGFDSRPRYACFVVQDRLSGLEVHGTRFDYFVEIEQVFSYFTGYGYKIRYSIHRKEKGQ